MLNRRCVPVSLDVVRPGVLSSFDLRGPLLVHKVPWHLVRLALQDTAGTAGRGDGHRAGGGVPGVGGGGLRDGAGVGGGWGALGGGGCWRGNPEEATLELEFN